MQKFHVKECYSNSQTHHDDLELGKCLNLVWPLVIRNIIPGVSIGFDTAQLLNKIFINSFLTLVDWLNSNVFAVRPKFV
jgi:hypothetical protein